MYRRKNYCILIFVLCITMLIGCGKTATEQTSKEDDSIVVQVPAGNSVKGIFDFKSTKQISLQGGASFDVSDGIINVGKLDNGDSILWRSDTEFLYIHGEAKETSIISYGKKLMDDPISYDEFKKQYKTE